MVFLTLTYPPNINWYSIMIPAGRFFDAISDVDYWWSCIHLYRFNIGTHLNKGCSNKNGECGQEHKGHAPLYDECDCKGCEQQCKVLDQQGDAISNCSPHSWRISRETSCYFPTVVLVHIKPANLIPQYTCQQQFFFGMTCWMLLNTIISITISSFSSYF